jgi:hypothetical protein
VRASVEAEEQPFVAPRRHFVRLTLIGGTAAAILAIVLVFQSNHPANANSPVNRAPAAAAASRYVRFDSVSTITVGSHQRERYVETGSIDFVHRNYSTVLDLGEAGGVIEQRRVGTEVYLAKTPHGEPLAGTRWVAIALAAEPAARFASAPESEQFTAPPVVLDALGSTRSPVTIVGHAMIDNAPTTEYETQTTLAAFLRAASGDKTQPVAYNTVYATITVGLDRLNRPRLVTELVQSGVDEIITRVHFAGYGMPTIITAPPKHVIVTRAPVSASTPFLFSPSRVFERLLFALKLPQASPLD